MVNYSVGEFIELRDTFWSVIVSIVWKGLSGTCSWKVVCRGRHTLPLRWCSFDLIRVIIIIFRQMAEYAVSTVVFPDGVRHCMEIDFYCTSLIPLFDLCFDWQIICYNIPSVESSVVRPCDICTWHWKTSYPGSLISASCLLVHFEVHI